MSPPMEEVLKLGREFFNINHQKKAPIIHLGITNVLKSVLVCLNIVMAVTLTMPQVVGNNLICVADMFPRPDEVCKSKWYYLPYGHQAFVDYMNDKIELEFGYFLITHWILFAFGKSFLLFSYLFIYLLSFVF